MGKYLELRGRIYEEARNNCVIAIYTILLGSLNEVE
jgi:hypothetical protein